MIETHTQHAPSLFDGIRVYNLYQGPQMILQIDPSCMCLQMMFWSITIENFMECLKMHFHMFYNMGLACSVQCLEKDLSTNLSPT